MTFTTAIRRLTPSDPERLTAEFAKFGWIKSVEQYEGYLKEQRNDRRISFIAEFDDRIAGYVTLNWHPSYPPFSEADVPEIQDLNVLPPFQRHGIGSALIKAAEDAAWQRSDAVGICVGLGPDYGPAQRLYVRLGYVPDGRGAAYAGRTVEQGERVIVDDAFVLYFTKHHS